MKTETIVMCVVALILGMLMANMFKSVCGCETVVEGGSGGEKDVNYSQKQIFDMIARMRRGRDSRMDYLYNPDINNETIS